MRLSRSYNIIMSKVTTFISRKRIIASSRTNMAPTFVNFMLPATLLVAVVVAGLPGLNISNPNGSVIQLPQQSQLAPFPEGYVAHPDIRVAYKVHDVELKWTAARRRCNSAGAHLAVIDSNLKFEHLMTQVTSERTWTDIHKMHRDTEWVSSNTGLPMTTLPWGSGEPYGDNDCAAASQSPRGLKSFYCTDKYTYACELPIPENYNA